MKKVEDYERVRKAYFVENLSIREISRKYKHSRKFVRKAISQPAPEGYCLKKPRPRKVMGPFGDRIQELLEESKQLPRKQRYTARKIYELINKEGYLGSEGSVHNYVSRERKKVKTGKAYLPLEFDPGKDAQVDWGEAVVIMKGKRTKVQFFAIRLNYSRVRFVKAYPFQKQEAFLDGHVSGFHFFGGVPFRITYDNLKTAVFRILEGHNRQEQEAFTTFRSYYLFDSNYCNPAQGHEKGGVENDVGYIQRNFFSPLPEVEGFEELNRFLLECCQQDVHRHIRGESSSVEDLWEAEKHHFLALPSEDYRTCITYPVKVNPYSQVVLDTNRYSVPSKYAQKQLVLRAYPFQIEVLYLDNIVAEHMRCFEREQDILDPLHYLSLLEQRPAAFERAKPLRHWRKKWPSSYDQLLNALQKDKPEGDGVREFLAVLKLHQTYPPAMVKSAIHAAVETSMMHLDGVQYHLRQQIEIIPSNDPMDMSAFPDLAHVGQQAVDLQAYNQLLEVEL